MQNKISLAIMAIFQSTYSVQSVVNFISINQDINRPE
jgi:hypothetical protein